MTDIEWERLALPIQLAFVVQNSRTSKPTAVYPSPGGGMESLLTLENWSELVEKNPALAALKPDVEALLVNRTGEARQYFIAPIDACYELVGLVRSHWRGFSGGDAVWEEIRNFFARLEERSEPVRNERPEAVHA
jgi:hypothetical protein